LKTGHQAAVTHR